MKSEQVLGWTPYQCSLLVTAAVLLLVTRSPPAAEHLLAAHHCPYAPPRYLQRGCRRIPTCRSGSRRICLCRCDAALATSAVAPTTPTPPHPLRPQRVSPLPRLIHCPLWRSGVSASREIRTALTGRLYRTNIAATTQGARRVRKRRRGVVLRIWQRLGDLLVAAAKNRQSPGA